METEKPWYKKLSYASLIISTVVGLIAIIGFIKDHKTYPDLEGTWTMTFQVQESSYTPYINDVSVYEIYVDQSKSLISGRGEQTYYNGRHAKLHFKLDWKDVDISGGINIPYTLYGSRKTSGMMLLQMDKNEKKHLTGTFTGAAADTKGAVDIRITK
jgi:hypothetical protein